MQIAVIADNKQWDELTLNDTGIEWVRAVSSDEISLNSDAYFFLKDPVTVDIQISNKPVFINSMNNTLTELGTAGNYYRINAWNGFLEMQHWEIAGKMNEDVVQVLLQLKKKYSIVADQPGFVSARIISMIINEAYFALEENVSTKKEIDVAMRLGTNYPYGPFEWASVIGTKNIYHLLKKLAGTDKRYTPSALLQKEAIEWV
jgi:3-hydroxybutyryl-CoA dehydrogenase